MDNLMKPIIIKIIQIFCLNSKTNLEMILKKKYFLQINFKKLTNLPNKLPYIKFYQQSHIKP